MNDQFASYATSTAFGLSLSKRMVDVLLYLDALSTHYDLHPTVIPDRWDGLAVSPFHYTEQSLKRRGLIESKTLEEIGSVKGCDIPCACDALVCECGFADWWDYLPDEESASGWRPVSIVDLRPVTYPGRLVAELCREAGLQSSFVLFEPMLGGRSVGTDRNRR